MTYKCLRCRGLANAGSLPRGRQWEWRAETIRGESEYHLVRLGAAVMRVAGGGEVYAAETACGEGFLEELPVGD